MYVPRAFRIGRDEAERFLSHVEFAQLVTVRDGLPVATHLEGASKLSQNKSGGDRAGVVTGLRREGNAALADAMEAVTSRRDENE